LNRNIGKFYWMQLLALAAVHFVVDLFAGMPPAILPAIRDEFGWRLSQGAFVFVVLYLTCNGVQVLTGHVRSGKRQPLLLHLGLVMAAGICLPAALPRGEATFPLMLLLAVISGFGIAVVHPEALRAVHRLKRIQPAVSTAVFMAGGFLGGAAGGGVSALLVSHFGFPGLYPLIGCSVFGVLAIILLRIRLAVEPTVPNERTATKTSDVRSLPFGWVFAMAMPAAVSTTALAFLLPTVLVDELGFDLTFGGYSTTAYFLGGSAGAFLWAHVARKRGELVCTIVALLLSLPFLLAYLLLIERTAAILILLGAGFCTISAYTLMITLARHATGPKLGRRMGMMVGGTWASAYVIFMAMLYGAEQLEISTKEILNLTPWGYLFSGIFGVFVALRVGAAPCSSPQIDRQ
jgi:MFS family permease